MGSVRVAIIGVGNCASALVQGVHYYQGAPDDAFIPGLMRPRLGRLPRRRHRVLGRLRHRRPQGRPRPRPRRSSSAPNNTVRFAEVPPLGVPVQRGMTHDGLGHYLSQMITKAPGSTADIAGILRETRTDVVVNFLPVGSEMATKWYVEQVLDAGCALRQLHPGLHRARGVLAAPLRGARPAGGGRRREVAGRRHHRPPRAHPALHGPRACGSSAPASSTSAATPTSTTCWSATASSPRRSPRPTRCARSSPTSCPPTPSTSAPATTCRGSQDRKWAHIRLEGRGFGDQPINVELKLEVWDSPNSAGVVIDAIRCCKIALDRGLKGALLAPSAYLMKSPPEQWADDVARARASSGSSPAKSRRRAVDRSRDRAPPAPAGAAVLRAPARRPCCSAVAPRRASSVAYALTALTFTTSTRALLPADAPYVQRYVEYDREFGELDDIVIVVEAPSLPEAHGLRRPASSRSCRRPGAAASASPTGSTPSSSRAARSSTSRRSELREIRDKIFDYQEFMETFAARPDASTSSSRA